MIEITIPLPTGRTDVVDAVMFRTVRFRQLFAGALAVRTPWPAAGAPQAFL